MKPGVAKPPVSKHPYFFAAYGVVWAVLFAYALWLGSRIRSLEQKVTSATNRSR
jgi:CcmD family protein